MINKKIGHINRDQFTSIQLSAEKKTTNYNSYVVGYLPKLLKRKF